MALLGPPQGPVLAQKGPFGGPEQPLGPKLVPTATGWSNWVGCIIHIMGFGPLRDLQSTPGAPKKARFDPKGPFGGPRTSSESPGEPDLVPTATGWSN